MTESTIPVVRRAADREKITIAIEAQSMLLRPANMDDEPMIVINNRHMLDELLRDALGVASDQLVRLGNATLTVVFERSDSY